MKPALLLLTMALAGCGVLPRDSDRTSTRIAATRQMTVGVTAHARQSADLARFVQEVATETGARPRIVTGDAEPLLVQLEAGKLDIALAWFDEKSPWADRVALAPVLAARGQKGHRLELRAAARNGESRWVMLLEKVSRQVAPGMPS